jgi:agmatinase
LKNTIPHNFGGLPKRYSNYKKSHFVVLPIPFDETSSWLKGSDKGPRAIIEASKNLELYDIETNSEAFKKGICTEKEILSHDIKKIIQMTHIKVKDLLLDGKFIVTLGGEHTVSLGPIKAHTECYNNVTILHLDAHSDMRFSYEGNRYSHACVMARVREITDNIVSVGIRSMDSSELKYIDRKRMFYAHEIFKSNDWIERVMKKLSGNVYVSIDLDVFDPSIMPSTGTPEPGGLNWYHVVELLKTVSKKKRIIGCDVVELCPSLNRAPDFLAAKLIYTLLSFLSV